MHSKTATFILEQNGKTIQAGTSYENFKLYSIEGLSGLDFDFVMTNNPQSPNAIINNKKPLPRNISFKLYCSGEYRQFLNSFFNPFVKGKLIVEWNGVSRWIEYYSYPITIVQETAYRQLKIDVKLLCPEPYWKDMSDYGKDIASKQDLIAFPFVMLAKKGVITDYRLFKTDVGIQNTGDVSVGMKIIFKATGRVINPKLSINNSEYVRALITMQAGDELIFNTDIEDTYVTLNGEDILNKTDPFMSFFQVPIGDNTIRFEAEEGTANLRVLVFYTPQYVNL